MFHCVQHIDDECLDAVTVSFPIPAATPNGDYLLRVEHIALHTATSAGGAQFYISCGQVTVTGGGSGTPGPLVAFPGAYSATDPGIMIDIYYPVVRSQPGVLRVVWCGMVLMRDSPLRIPSQGQLWYVNPISLLSSLSLAVLI